MDKNYEGHLKLFGKNVKNMSEKEWCDLRNNTVKIVFQDYKLLNNLTAFENIFYSGNYKSKSINKIMKELNILEYKNQKVNELSGGQKQRLALARSIIAKPKIIFLDEPTGNLDGLAIENVLNIFNKLKDRNILLLIITHDEKIIEYADVVYELKNKQLIKRN